MTRLARSRNQGLSRLLLSCACCCILTSTPTLIREASYADDDTFNAVVIVKVGGSSITRKATKETLNETALNWVASVLASEVSPFFLVRPKIVSNLDERHVCTARQNTAFVIVHGAGSFGHHTAKQYGLKGHAIPPPTLGNDRHDRRLSMAGLTETRLSVQKLNHLVVSNLVRHGINAVGISPCFGIPGMEAHGGNTTILHSLLTVVHSTLQAGLVPVLHGDACLYGEKGAGILSGDVLMTMLGSARWVSRAIFLTDVDGVFTRDPRIDPTARLLRTIQVDEFATIQDSSLLVEASKSMHSHDVTGGLKVRAQYKWPKKYAVSLILICDGTLLHDANSQNWHQPYS
jgi:isopentenyl phosphate kinase